MKILSLKRFATPLSAVLISCVPLKTAKFPAVQIERDAFCKQTTLLTKDITYGLKKEFVTNFRGGVIERFDSVSIDLLKKRLKQDTTKVLEYCFPIKETEKAYTEPFGAFLAKRPDGREHMGLDIFVSKLSRKPKTPITIVSPVDGIIISNKFARKSDNVIANFTSVLGVDGRTYLFDHMARGTDYPDSIPRHRVGEKVKRGTPLGYVGSTGETALWHLHFGVVADSAYNKQQKDTVWLNRAKTSPFMSLRGYVDPKNKKDAGKIADILNEVLK